MEQFDWGRALIRLRHGVPMRRLAWSPETTWVIIGKDGQFTLRESWQLTPWAPYLDDFDATDWVEVPEGG